MKCDRVFPFFWQWSDLNPNDLELQQNKVNPKVLRMDSNSLIASSKVNIFEYKKHAKENFLMKCFEIIVSIKNVLIVERKRLCFYFSLFSPLIIITFSWIGDENNHKNQNHAFNVCRHSSFIMD